MWHWRYIHKIKKKVKQILALEDYMRKQTDQSLKSQTNLFLERLKKGETLDDILVEAFAIVREVSYRTIKLFPFPCQIFGAIVLHNGDIAEMKTGEGKTLTSVMPIYLNALTKKGVHVITVNEYLAKRDADWNKPIFEYLGMTVGCNLSLSELPTTEKRKAYACDITYSTHSELGFDYLRDNMVKKKEHKVQRGLNVALIDESDSILIDEARVPLIISSGKKEREKVYLIIDNFTKKLDNKDYYIDLETRQISLTNSGIKKAETEFKLKNLYDAENAEFFHLILNSLKAVYVIKKGVEYLVKSGKIVLIDQSTGHLMEGRSYSDGLQQAIQAKEKVKIEPETIICATITYQNLFRLYNKLSGMTGTAKSEEEEFIKVYNTRVIEIPTNLPMIRKDDADYFYYDKKTKLKALAKEVKSRHEKGQPILIGTTNVNNSEEVADILKSEGITNFSVLNAKNHAFEAKIIAGAGQKKAITVATNRAGRGVDIKLGEGVKELGEEFGEEFGGLAVLGAEHNESIRIDNQFKGRSGRQNDPGYSCFFVSLDDEIIKRFSTERMKRMFSHLNDDYIKSSLLTKSILKIQERIQGYNFDARKNVLDYDNVAALHRQIIYKERDYILNTKELKEYIKSIFQKMSENIINENLINNRNNEEIINYKNLLKELKKISQSLFNKIDIQEINKKDVNQLFNFIFQNLFSFYQEKLGPINKYFINEFEQSIILNVLDEHWSKHIDILSKLRSGIYLRSYAQTNPLQAYIHEAEILFLKMKKKVNYQTVCALINLNIKEYQTNIISEIFEKFSKNDILSMIMKQGG
jgi:preprotein translocase subunit SecA